MIIRGHDLENHTVKQFDEINQMYGVEGYQLAIKKSFEIDQQILDFKAINGIDGKVFSHTKILGAYFNPVHPDDKEVAIGIENFVFNMRLAEQFGIKYVATETGSCLGSPWNYHPDNHKPQTISRVVMAMKEISKRTVGIDVAIAIEPAYHHVIKDVDSLNNIYDAIGDSRIVYVLDIFNLLNERSYMDYIEVLEEFLIKAGPKLKIVHLKDFEVISGVVKQVPIGRGIVNFDYVINAIKAVNNEVLFVLEGTLERDFKAAKKIIGPI